MISRVIMISLIALAAAPTCARAAEDVSGPAEFRSRCALCHGNDGRGFGPLNEGDKTRKAADLTQISKRNGGHFPFSLVAEIIRRGGSIGEHTDRLMPSWGEFYGKEADALYADAMLFRLTRYVESLQEK